MVGLLMGTGLSGFAATAPGQPASTDSALDRAIKKAKGLPTNPPSKNAKKKGMTPPLPVDISPESALPPENAPAAPLAQQYSFAFYQIWFRGSAANTTVSMRLQNPDGSTRLTHLPLEGTGPWMDSARSQWHRAAFTDMAKTGVDAALIQYRPDEASRSEWGRRGVDMAVQALRELRIKGETTPALALYLDFNGKTKWDLSRDADREALYSVVREFYRRIPRPFRSSVVLKGTDWPSATPLFLGAPDGLTGWSADWATDLRARFLKEFGSPLALAGDQAWKTDAPNMDAYFGLDPQKPLVVDETGPLHTATLTPGYNERGILDDQPIRSRLNSRPYLAAWNDVGKHNPDWVLLNSWNGWREGTEISASREAGNRDLNLTRGALANLDSGVPLRARLHSHTVPAVFVPGSLTRVDFRVENAGLQPWPAATSYLRYQWLQGDAVVGKGDTVLIHEVRPREETTVGFLLPVRSASGPLPPGDYRLRITLALPKTDVNPGGNLSLGEYSVHLGDRPGMAASLLESETPSLLQPGLPYRVHVRLRNDGTETWTKADYAVTYRWRKVSDGAGDDSTSTPNVGVASALKTPLRVDVIPGTLADLTADVAARDDTGSPLEGWSPDLPWHYELEWNVTGPKGNAVALDSDVVEVVPQALGVDFPLGSGIPHAMDADKPYDLKVVVKNIGPVQWKPSQVSVGFRWYYWDGVPMNWESKRVDAKGPLGELRPGEQALVHVPLQSPPFSGMFLIGVDAMVDGVWASDAPAVRGTALLPEAVVVSGGGLRPLPISPMYNLDGIATDILASDGDFDGGKYTFPGQLLPPQFTSSDVQGALYPSGYLGPVKGVGLDANRHIPFEYPPKTDGTPNMIVCAGQAMNVSIPRCHALHLLMAADEDSDVTFSITYATGAVQTERINMTAWDKAPAFDNETVGFYSPVRNGPFGVERHDAYLKHYTIPCDSKRMLTGVELPNDPHVKIVAITAESW